MPRALGYVRVSTQEQAHEGVSIEAQEKKIRTWCEAQETPLVEVFIDAGLSGGWIDNRPELRRALNTCKRGDILVFYSLSRLRRTTRDVLAIMDELQGRGVDVVCLSEKIDTSSATGKLAFHMLAIIGEFERDVISERTRMAIQHLQRQARFTGGHRPFGWKVEPDGSLVPVTAELSLIARVRELRVSGMGYRQIARVLHVEGFRPPNGTRFHAEQIRRWVWSIRPLELDNKTSGKLPAADNRTEPSE